MRTTLSLDDDVLPDVRKYAQGRGLSVGKAVSELVRRGLRAPLQTRVVNGFHVAELPAGSPPITLQHVRRVAEELE